jgi:hypothetical protein
MPDHQGHGIDPWPELTDTQPGFLDDFLEAEWGEVPEAASVIRFKLRDRTCVVAIGL